MDEVTRKGHAGITPGRGERLTLPYIAVRYIATGAVHRPGTRPDDLLFVDNYGAIHFTSMNNGASTKSFDGYPAEYEFVTVPAIEQNAGLLEECVLHSIKKRIPMERMEPYTPSDRA